jgi:hypothetical protein
MAEARLSDLAAWLAAKIMAHHPGEAKVSAGEFGDFSDLHQVVELARAGYLDDGRRLERIDFCLRDERELVTLAAGEQFLSLREIVVQRLK